MLLHVFNLHSCVCLFICLSVCLSLPILLCVCHTPVRVLVRMSSLTICTCLPAYLSARPSLFLPVCLVSGHPSSSVTASSSQSGSHKQQRQNDTSYTHNPHQFRTWNSRIRISGSYTIPFHHLGTVCVCVCVCLRSNVYEE